MTAQLEIAATRKPAAMRRPGPCGRPVSPTGGRVRPPPREANPPVRTTPRRMYALLRQPPSSVADAEVGSLGIVRWSLGVHVQVPRARGNDVPDGCLVDFRPMPRVLIIDSIESVMGLQHCCANASIRSSGCHKNEKFTQGDFERSCEEFRRLPVTTYIYETKHMN